MSDTYAGSCKDCKFCSGDVMSNTGRCSIIKDPVKGTPLNVPYARMDEWQGYKLPCGYKGLLWRAKDGA